MINQQSGKLQGILNGIDTQLYDPAANPGLACNYTFKTLDKGKAACKQALQQAVGLQENPDVPIIATGGPTEESILRTIQAGANAITYTPPSNGVLFARIMNQHRKAL